jgi:predicted nucleotidyltransferase
MDNQLSIQDSLISKELKSLLANKYNSIIEKIYCYGSRVYSHKKDSDFDLLIVTYSKINWQEERIIYKDIFKFGLEKDIQFDVKFFSSEELNITYKQMPFLKNILSYGILV